MEELNVYEYVPYIIIVIFIISFIIIYYNKQTIYNDNIFDKIYKEAHWGQGSINGGSSGHGSSPEMNKEYINYLNNFIKKNNIQSIVDIGCGDWQIMNHINLLNIDYSGFDVAEEVINRNNNLYKTSTTNFYKTELGEYYNYPKADLLICKDVLQHLDYQNINNILTQLDKYEDVIIINDFSENTVNQNIPNGGWRELDITKEPFNIKINYQLYLWNKHDTARKVLLHKFK